MRASDFYLWVLISNAIGCLFALQENEIGFMVMLMHLSHSYIDSSRYTGLSLASGNQSENRQLNLSRTEKECAHAKWLNYFVMERKVNTRNEIEGAIKGRESTRRKREKKAQSAMELDIGSPNYILFRATNTRIHTDTYVCRWAMLPEQSLKHTNIKSYTHNSHS